MCADCSRVVVFTGPSLHPRAAAALLNATILPPIKRGDLEPFLASKPAAVGIIDGEFYQSLAVSPKEVLALLETGVAVYGAASMGALRAVELGRYGMIGVGSVFRLFRRGVLDSDDEVAVTYCKETWRPLSEPLVNTRYALRAAVRKGILTGMEAARIISNLRPVYFPERTRELALRLARDVAGADRALALRNFLATEAPNIKERDAKLLLQRIRQDFCYDARDGGKQACHRRLESPPSPGMDNRPESPDGAVGCVVRSPSANSVGTSGLSRASRLTPAAVRITKPIGEADGTKPI